MIDHSNDERITYELDAKSVLKIAQWSSYVLVILMANNPAYVDDIRGRTIYNIMSDI